LGHFAKGVIVVNLRRFRLCGALCLLALTGCVKSEAMEFNDSIAGVTKDLENYGRTFGETLRWQKNRAQSEKVWADLNQKVKGLVDDAKKIKVPPGKEARAMWYAFQNYLKTEEHIIRVDFRDLMVFMSQAYPNQSQVQSIINRMQTEENRDLNALKQAQAVFAKAHGIVILQ
jgi:hypothetical protein